MAALVPMMALAAYGVLGVFGHSLHGLLPCDDATCRPAEAAASCTYCHDEPTAPRVLGPAKHGAEFRSHDHDASHCSLCTLLAKVKVGRLSFYLADVSVRQIFEAPCDASAAPSLELVLTGAPRGPPAC
jgi:hypothetical protein